MPFIGNLDLTKIKEDYYTAAEVAEIRGVTRQAVNSDLHAGKYPGAFQLEIGKKPWLIPKETVDSPVITKDVITLTRQIAPSELQQLFNSAITIAVNTAIEPLQQKINEQEQQIQVLIDQNKLAAQQTISLDEKLDVLLGETRMERKAKKGFFSRLFGN